MLKMAGIYLIIINIVTFLMYGIDKSKARRNKWRIKESVLIGMAAVGGCYGAILGMNVFRHKTNKPLFYILIPILVVIYTGLVYFILIY